MKYIAMVHKDVDRDCKVRRPRSPKYLPNKETLAAMLEAEELSRDPNAKRYTSVQELFADLNSDE